MEALSVQFSGVCASKFQRPGRTVLPEAVKTRSTGFYRLRIRLFCRH